MGSGLVAEGVGPTPRLGGVGPLRSRAGGHPSARPVGGSVLGGTRGREELDVPDHRVLVARAVVLGVPTARLRRPSTATSHPLAR